MITVMTENKKFTLKTDSDQSDKLFNKIVSDIITDSPRTGRVLNIKKTLPDKINSAVMNNNKPVIEVNQDISRSDQNKDDQNEPDTVSKYDGYKGFLHIKCQNCGKVGSFCSKDIIKSYSCPECNKKTPLRNLSHLWLNCECGRTSRYFTNMTEFAFDVNCIECGAPVAVKWNSRKKLYDTIRGDD